MARQFWRRFTKLWREHEARLAAPAEYAYRMEAAKYMLKVCGEFQHEVLLRSLDASAITHTAAICNSLRYLILASRDLDILVNPYPEPWRAEVHGLHARVQALIVYECLMDRGAILGKDLRAALKAYQLNEAIAEINRLNKKLTEIDARHHDLLKRIRNTVIGHREKVDAEFAMVIAGPRLIAVDLITKQVQECVQLLCITLMKACEAIAKTVLQKAAEPGARLCENAMFW
jgi:hypothetical protein